eukprot:IDg21335t1
MASRRRLVDRELYCSGQGWEALPYSKLAIRLRRLSRLRPHRSRRSLSHSAKRLPISPQNPAECTGPGNVVGTGKCGVNGNERVFNTDQIAADCSGNVAGSFRSGNVSFDTKTTVALGGSDTVLYQVRLSQDAPSAAGELFQNQLTTVGADGTRVRSAHALLPGTGTARALSFFREERVTEDVWRRRLAEVRAQFNVLASDYCGWDIARQRPNRTCAEHFTFPKCKFSVTRRVCRRSRRFR